MTSLHPHWQSTDEHERPVHITARSSHERASQPTFASRKPAAIAGIALMIAIAFVWTGGISSVMSLLGQASTSVTVTITSGGVDPETVTVTPGETITWTNTDTIPQILASDTLPTSDGQPFQTSAIFPNSSTHFLVPVNAPDGTYEYVSQTSQNISGHIVIQGATSIATSSGIVAPQQDATQQQPSMPPAAMTQPSAPAADQSALPLIPSLDSNISSQAATEPTQPQQNQVPPLGAAAQLPDNPHTVATEASLPPRQGESTTAATTGAPTDVPTTGPDVDVVVALSAMALLWVSRKAFAFKAS